MRKFIRRYSELKMIPSFEDRFDYLRLSGIVGKGTFGFERYLNQKLYHSSEWKRVRREVILRDCGLDMGAEGHEILGKIIIHHMNPISAEDILKGNPDVFDPEFLICVSEETHNAIHYGDKSKLPKVATQRFPGDTKLW